MTMDMYKQNILEHYKHPKNFGELPDADVTAHVANPLCGDEIDLMVKFSKDGTVEDVKFSGRGCAISMAAASIMTDKLRGLDKEALKHLESADVLQALGVEVNPSRLQCATLSLKAIHQATDETQS